MAKKKKKKKAPKQKKKKPYKVQRLFPQEYEVLIPSLEVYFKEIGFKEAHKNPSAIVNNMMQKDPNLHVYAVTENDLDYPLEVAPEIHGFLIFKILIDAFNSIYMHVEHVYISNEKRNSNIFESFMDILFRNSRDNRVKYTTIDAPTPRLQRIWKRMGFGVEHVHMSFKGNYSDFYNKGINCHHFGEDYGVEKQFKTGKQTVTTESSSS